MKIIYTPEGCLIWYDGPQLWYGKLDTGGYGLAMCTEDEEDIITWMVVKVSRRRLNAILNNCTTLREAFRFPEEGKHYRVTNYPLSPAAECLPWLEPITEADLSGPGCRLLDRSPGREWKRTHRKKDGQVVMRYITTNARKLRRSKHKPRRDKYQFTIAKPRTKVVYGG